MWNDDIDLQQLDFDGIDLFHREIANKRGGVIFTAHLGNMEVVRSLAKLDSQVKINAVVFADNAKKITAFLEKINPEVKLNLISLDHIDVPLALNLQEKIVAGEFIIIACDRVSPTIQAASHTRRTNRIVSAEFLGVTANFPAGPFILAGLLQCPVYFMLCLKASNNVFKVVFKEFIAHIDMAKNMRALQLHDCAQLYANLLSEYCRQYPLQWFNFFDFWKTQTYEQKK